MRNTVTTDDELYRTAPARAAPGMAGNARIGSVAAAVLPMFFR